MDSKGQGALEYLLLIGGAVLIATIVLVVIVTSTTSANGIVGNQANAFNNQLQHRI